MVRRAALAQGPFERGERFASVAGEHERPFDPAAGEGFDAVERDLDRFGWKRRCEVARVAHEVVGQAVERAEIAQRDVQAGGGDWLRLEAVFRAQPGREFGDARSGGFVGEDGEEEGVGGEHDQVPGCEMSPS